MFGCRFPSTACRLVLPLDRDVDAAFGHQIAHYRPAFRASTRAAASRTRSRNDAECRAFASRCSVDRADTSLGPSSSSRSAPARTARSDAAVMLPVASEAAASIESVTTTPRKPSRSRRSPSMIGRDCDAMRFRSRAGVARVRHHHERHARADRGRERRQVDGHELRAARRIVTGPSSVFTVAAAEPREVLGGGGDTPRAPAGHGRSDSRCSRASGRWRTTCPPARCRGRSARPPPGPG